MVQVQCMHPGGKGSQGKSSFTGTPIPRDARKRPLRMQVQESGIQNHLDVFGMDLYTFPCQETMQPAHRLWLGKVAADYLGLPIPFLSPPEHPPMFIDLSLEDACAGDPLPVLGKDTGDLVDIDLRATAFSPENIDLAGHGQGLLAHNEGIEVRVECRPVPVAEGLDGIAGGKTLRPDKCLEGLLPLPVRKYGVDFSCCKGICRQPDDDLAAWAGKFE